MKRRVSGYFSHSLNDRPGTSPEALRPAGIVVETRAKNYSKSLKSLKKKRMGSYLLRPRLQMQSTGASFCKFFMNNQLLSKILLLMFSPCFNQLIKLFRSKENFKEKIYGCMTKNEFEVISIFKIIIRICKKIFEFCGKTFKFLPKRCLFIFCTFYLNKEELIQQACLKKSKMKSNSSPHKTKKQKKRSKNIIQLHNYHF